MGDTNEYTVHDLVRDELYKNMDVEYGKFTASLSPGAGNIIGVRIPVLRKMAKEIASVNWKEYLDGARDDTFEEVMLQGIVLGYARGKIDDILTWDGSYQRSMTGRSAIPAVIPLRSQTSISRKCGIS